ncbi:MAG: hypothetical protein BroJett030_29930 [Alphaproteobacteria bacterium]|nr:MAG: hypothetical protein BroJett030_29930 [Alphaproteobacteria bacterium]
MDSIEQLRAMRDAARERIEALPDYKLMTKLTTLIEELEEIFGVGEAAPAAGEAVAEEPEEEVDLAPAPAEAQDAEAPAEPLAVAPEEPVQPRQGLHRWQSPLAAATAMQPAEAAPSVPDVAEGLAQAEIEETVVASPAEELVDEPEQIDSSAALEQAMAELEADLGNAELEPNVSRFRYGNSS